MSKVHLPLEDRSYDILIGIDTFASLGENIKRLDGFEGVVVITDPIVSDLYGREIRSSLRGSNFEPHIIEVGRGERYKNLNQAAHIYDKLVELNVHRDSLIVALGGGVIGDLAGFVAATYMRGVPYIQVPTTLLAQVDASLGGKTAVDHPKCKNLIGVFYQPKLVYIDVKTLTTLPLRELRCGLAEVVKYGIIEDSDFFKFLEANAHHLNTKAFEEVDTQKAALKLWQTIVTECCKIKARIVSHDEKELGQRMILNFGHTVGHAIETLGKYRTYSHGEAVSIGMVAACNIAKRMKMLEAKSVIRVKELFEALSLPTMVERFSSRKIIEILAIDKKVRGGKIQFVLPTKIGKVEIRNDIPIKVVRRVLKEIGCK